MFGRYYPGPQWRLVVRVIERKIAHEEVFTVFLDLGLSECLSVPLHTQGTIALGSISNTTPLFFFSLPFMVRSRSPNSSSVSDIEDLSAALHQLRLAQDRVDRVLSRLQASSSIPVAVPVRDHSPIAVSPPRLHPHRISPPCWDWYPRSYQSSRSQSGVFGCGHWRYPFRVPSNTYAE